MLHKIKISNKLTRKQQTDQENLIHTIHAYIKVSSRSIFVHTFCC